MGQAKYEIRRKCPICGAVFQIRIQRVMVIAHRKFPCVRTRQR